MTYRHTQPGTLILAVRRVGTDDPQGVAEALKGRRGA